MIEKGVLTYDDMVVQPWLYETFRTSLSIFAQKDILPGEVLPVYDKEEFKGYYQNALLATGKVSAVDHYRESSWADFVEILPNVAERLPIVPLSNKYTISESLANKIIELRDDSEIKEARNKLYKVFLDLKLQTPREEIAEELAKRINRASKEKKKISRRMLLKSTLGSFVFGSYFASIKIALELPKPVDLRITLLALPYFAYKYVESLERDFEKLESYCWTGLFEKLA